MSARVPNPEPKWDQSAEIDSIIPTDLDQVTGLERAELLAEMEGRDIFDKAVSLLTCKSLLSVRMYSTFCHGHHSVSACQASHVVMKLC